MTSRSPVQRTHTHLSTLGGITRQQYVAFTKGKVKGKRGFV